jgi:hypothetical protein
MYYNTPKLKLGSGKIAAGHAFAVVLIMAPEIEPLLKGAGGTAFLLTKLTSTILFYPFHC